MDENKELLTNEQDAENTENSDKDTFNEIPYDEAEPVADDLPEAETEESETDTEAVLTDAEQTALPTGKKRLLQFPIIIAIVIVAVAALSLLVYKAFFDTSITGTWAASFGAEGATPDEASGDEADEVKQYYVFDSNGKLKVSLGTFSYIYDYQTSVSEEGENQLIVTFNGNQSMFTYKLEGNLFTGRTLTLSNDYGAEDIVLHSTSYKKPDLEPEKDFKPSDKLTGSWMYDNGFTQMTYTFNDDGTVEINQMDTIVVEGVYSYTDKVIKVTYLADVKSEMDLVYTLEGETLTINDIPYKKVTEESKNTTEAATTKAK